MIRPSAFATRPFSHLGPRSPVNMIAMLPSFEADSTSKGHPPMLGYLVFLKGTDEGRTGEILLRHGGSLDDVGSTTPEQPFKRAAIVASVNHGMTVCTNNREIVELRQFRLGSISQRCFMMHNGELSADIAIHFEKIEAATGNLASQPSMTFTECLFDFGYPQVKLTTAMPLDGVKDLALDRRHLLIRLRVRQRFNRSKFEAGAVISVFVELPIQLPEHLHEPGKVVRKVLKDIRCGSKDWKQCDERVGVLKGGSELDRKHLLVSIYAGPIPRRVRNLIETFSEFVE